MLLWIVPAVQGSCSRSDPLCCVLTPSRDSHAVLKLTVASLANPVHLVRWLPSNLS